MINDLINKIDKIYLLLGVDNQVLEYRKYKDKTVFQIVFEYKSNPIAFLELYKWDDIKELSLNFAVLKEYRRKGILKLMFQIMLNGFRCDDNQIILYSVYSDNLDSENIAIKYGFKFSKNFYAQKFYTQSWKDLKNNFNLRNG